MPHRKTDLGAKAPTPAGHDVRFIAHVIDTAAIVLLLLAGLVVGLFLGNVIGRYSQTLGAVVVLLPPFLMHPWYYIWAARKSGATPGKRALGLSVVRVSGRPIGPGTLSLRYGGYLLSALTLGLGHLVVLARRDRRALHDHVAGTVVMQARPLSRSARAGWGLGAVVALAAFIAAGLWSKQKFDQFAGASNQAATKGNLNSLVSAISIYYGEHEGVYPSTLDTGPSSAFSRYLDRIPPVMATHAGIGKGTDESPSGTEVCYSTDENITAMGRGWRYNPKTGHIYVNSAATDARGVPYSTYGY
ncbi:MAG: RDD family protein [Candidatus Coatesbacteria bacterium]